MGDEKWGGGVWVVIFNIMVRRGLTKKVPGLQRDKCFAVEPALPVPTSDPRIQNLWEWGLGICIFHKSFIHT